MATKNGVCPHCNFSRLENRIFKVNPDASTVYCPFCMRELDPKQSIDLYNNIITKMLKKADDPGQEDQHREYRSHADNKDSERAC